MAGSHRRVPDRADGRAAAGAAGSPLAAIRPGDRVAIIGRSGTGKSVLLRSLLLGLLRLREPRGRAAFGLVLVPTPTHEQPRARPGVGDGETDGQDGEEAGRVDRSDGGEVMTDSSFEDMDDMCPNCQTPWKCNGPHLSGETPRFEREREQHKGRDGAPSGVAVESTTAFSSHPGPLFAAIREAHVIEDPEYHEGPRHCDSCWEDWPCSAAILLADVDRLRAVIAEANDAFSDIWTYHPDDDLPPCLFGDSPSIIETLPADLVEHIERAFLMTQSVVSETADAT